MKTLLNKVTVEWFKAAAIRALRTMAQTALGMLTIGAAINEINWLNVASVAFVAAVYSLLTSLATTLPEVATGSDGVLEIDSKGETPIYNMNFSVPLEELATKTEFRFTVNPNANLISVAQPEPSQE